MQTAVPGHPGDMPDRAAAVFRASDLSGLEKLSSQAMAGVTLEAPWRPVPQIQDLKEP